MKKDLNELNVEAIDIVLNDDELKNEVIEKIKSGIIPDQSLLYNDDMRRIFTESLSSQSYEINAAEKYIIKDITGFKFQDIPSNGRKLMKKMVKDGRLDTKEILFVNNKKVILPAFVRPMLPVKKGTFLIPESETVAKRMQDHKKNIENAIRATGKVENGNKIIGTAWLVYSDSGRNIVATNSHVAKDIKTNSSTIDFEYKNNSLKFKVTKKLYNGIGNGIDLSFVEIETIPINDIKPIGLSSKRAEAGVEVCAIGFPKYIEKEDGEQNYIDYIEFFRYIKEQIKRVSYGEVMKYVNNTSFHHDCSVFAGNSGSVLFDYKDNTAIGIHTGGVEKKHNVAIPASIIEEKLKNI